jgi:GDSL-like Lipase/Acylhydrolase family
MCRSMRRLSSAAVAATLFVSMLHGGIPAARAGRGQTVTYLALGDSLAVGYQPGKGETTKGYVDDLWRSVRQQIPALDLRNVGCAGETSLSMITGTRSPCRYAAGSQLDEAVAFLTAHPGQVAFITIDIGANDLFDRCLDSHSGLLDKVCAVGLLPGLRTRVTHIVDALSGAAGPDVPIVAMTYYDPLLGFWGLVPGGRALARASRPVITVLNAGLATAYRDAGATVADVAATFRIDDFTDTVVVPGRGRIPVNVALACGWTWFCSTKFFGDPHANRTGYQKIARTFERELQDLLP